MIRQRRKLIYLLGFMGSGKSTVGTLLASVLGWPLIDLDTVIEAGQGLSIREIFENSGEPFFRQIEHAALTEASKAEPAVIALGGGTFAQPPKRGIDPRVGGHNRLARLPTGDPSRTRCEGLENRPLFRDRAVVQAAFYGTVTLLPPGGFSDLDGGAQTGRGRRANPEFAGLLT